MAKSYRNFMDMSLALEEEGVLELNDGMSADGTIEIDEVVAMEEEAEELAELTSEIESSNDVIEESTDVAENIEDQVEVNEQIIDEAPGDVTDEVVMASQEQFFINLAKLNFSIEDIKSRRISMEESVSPIVKLRLSNEGMLDVLAEIWRRIKQFAANVGNKIAIFVKKAQAYLTSKDSAVKALIGKMKDAAPTASLSADDIEKLDNKLGLFSALCAETKEIGFNKLAGVIDSGIVKEITRYASTGASTTYDSGMLKSMLDMIGIVVDYDDKYNRVISVNILKDAIRVTYIDDAESVRTDTLKAKAVAHKWDETFDKSKVLMGLESIAKGKNLLMNSINEIEKARQTMLKAIEEVSKGKVKKSWNAASKDEKEQLKNARRFISNGNKMANVVCFNEINSSIRYYNIIYGALSIVAKAFNVSSVSK